MLYDGLHVAHFRPGWDAKIAHDGYQYVVVGRLAQLLLVIISGISFKKPEDDFRLCIALFR